MTAGYPAQGNRNPLQSSIGANDVAARLGGDEFVVLQIGSNVRDEAARFAQRLILALGRPMSISGQEIISTISVGVALAPEHGDTAARLLKSADLALYKAKNEGRDCVRFYVPEMEMATLERIRIDKALRDAIKNDRLLCNTNRSLRNSATSLPDSRPSSACRTPTAR